MVIRDPATYRRRGRTHLLAQADLDLLFLDEVAEGLYKATGRWPALATLCRELRIRLGLYLEQPDVKWVIETCLKASNARHNIYDEDHLYSRKRLLPTPGFRV